MSKVNVTLEFENEAEMLKYFKGKRAPLPQAAPEMTTPAPFRPEPEALPETAAPPTAAPDECKRLAAEIRAMVTADTITYGPKLGALTNGSSISEIESVGDIAALRRIRNGLDS